AVEVVMLPRRIAHRFRLTRFCSRSTWRLWSGVAQRVQPNKRRETYLSVFGLLLLFMLLRVWATGMIAGFAMMHGGFHTPLNVSTGIAPFRSYLYLSGTTFFP